jgi:hypothetical protein
MSACDWLATLTSFAVRKPASGRRRRRRHLFDLFARELLFSSQLKYIKTLAAARIHS